MTLPSLTISNFPYLAVVLFATIIILKSIEYTKTKQPGKANVFNPKLVRNAVRGDVGALVPFYDFIGITQFAAPDKISGGTFTSVVYGILLFVGLFLTELWYGHIGLILLLLVGLMAHIFLKYSRSFACLNKIDDHIVPDAPYCCGGNLLVFLLALCVNIFSTGGVTGMVVPLIVHAVIYFVMVMWDYYMVFDAKSQKKHRLCHTMFDRSGMYAVGAIVSMLLLTYVYSVALSFATVAISSSRR